MLSPACHLSTADVADGLYRSTLRLGQSLPSSAGIHELSTSGVHSADVAAGLVSSCLTFSPLPRRVVGRGGYFLLHLLALADLFPLGSGLALRCPDFPPASPPLGERPAAGRLSAVLPIAGKGNQICRPRLWAFNFSLHSRRACVALSVVPPTQEALFLRRRKDSSSDAGSVVPPTQEQWFLRRRSSGHAPKPPRRPYRHHCGDRIMRGARRRLFGEARGGHARGKPLMLIFASPSSWGGDMAGHIWKTISK